jgi:vacuolar-type H+-ATPase subunit F/Vma7
MTADARDRLLVLTDSHQAPGYRLAGVAVEVADDARAAIDRLTQILANGSEGGVIAVPRRYLEDAGPELEQRAEAAAVPLIIELPESGAKDAGSRQARLRALLARAVGYEITFEPAASG